MTPKRGMVSLVCGGILTGLLVVVAVLILFAVWADAMLFIEGVFSDGHLDCVPFIWNNGYTV
jgi:hypothetical protein